MRSSTCLGVPAASWLTSTMGLPLAMPRSKATEPGSTGHHHHPLSSSLILKRVRSSGASPATSTPSSLVVATAGGASGLLLGRVSAALSVASAPLRRPTASLRCRSWPLRTMTTSTCLSTGAAGHDSR